MHPLLLVGVPCDERKRIICLVVVERVGAGDRAVDRRDRVRRHGSTEAHPRLHVCLGDLAVLDGVHCRVVGSTEVGNLAKTRRAAVAIVGGEIGQFANAHENTEIEGDHARAGRLDGLLKPIVIILPECATDGATQVTVSNPARTTAQQ